MDERTDHSPLQTLLALVVAIAVLVLLLGVLLVASVVEQGSRLVRGLRGLAWQRTS